MSAGSALKAVATGAVAKAEKPKTIAGLLSDPGIKAQMALALPKHMTADRLARIALTEVRKNPKLGQCEQASFLGAIMQCAQLGLEPGGALGHCYLLPFENRKKNITEVQFIVGYRGMLDLARRSGQILSIEARVIYAADKYQIDLGLEPRLVHEPAWDADDRGPVKFVYAVAKLKDGGTQFDVMSRKEIDKVRDGSQGYKTAIKYDRTDNPWISHYEEMAKKTVLRRIFKYLPISIELQTAVGLDEMADVGLPQDNPLTVDMDTGEISGGDTGHGETTGNKGDQQGGGGEDAPELPTYAQFVEALNRMTDPVAVEVHAQMIERFPKDQQGELDRLVGAKIVELKKAAKN